MDDDFLEIQDHRLAGIRNGASSTPQSFVRTSNLSSREPSSPASTAPRSAGGKRKAEEVIDLTLSDDEDRPPHPVKRQSTSSLSTLTNTFPAPAPNPGAYWFDMPQRNSSVGGSTLPGYGIPGRR